MASRAWPWRAGSQVATVLAALTIVAVNGNVVHRQQSKLVLARFEDMDAHHQDAEERDVVDGDDLPSGWESAMDEGKKKPYFWRVDDPEGTRTYKKPTSKDALEVDDLK